MRLFLLYSALRMEKEDADRQMDEAHCPHKTKIRELVRTLTREHIRTPIVNITIMVIDIINLKANFTLNFNTLTREHINT